MAFVSNLDPDEQKNPNQGAVAPVGGGGVHLAPSSGVGSAGNGSGPSNSPAGGQFATLQTYLDANQGKAPDLANTITKGIGDQYNTLQGQNTQTLNDIQGQVTQGYTPENKDLLASEASNPVSFVSNPGNVSAFQAQTNDKYTGPGSAEGTGQYQNQFASLNNAIAKGQGDVSTEAGREGLLQGVENRPTAGVTALNSAILSQDPSSQSKIENAYQPFSNLISQFQTGAQGINQNIGQGQSQAQSAATNANKAIADQTAAINSTINNELSANQKTYNDYNTNSAREAKMLQTGNFNDIGQYGLDPRLANYVNNQVNPWMTTNAPNQSLSYNFSNAIPNISPAFAPTIGQSATPNDFAVVNALSALQGSPVSSPLNGVTPDATPYSVPTLPTVNNQALAGDIGSALQGISAPQSGVGYQQYRDLLYMLNQASTNGLDTLGTFSHPQGNPVVTGGGVAAR